MNFPLFTRDILPNDAKQETATLIRYIKTYQPARLFSRVLKISKGETVVGIHAGYSDGLEIRLVVETNNRTLPGLIETIEGMFQLHKEKVFRFREAEVVSFTASHLKVNFAKEAEEAYRALGLVHTNRRMSRSAYEAAEYKARYEMSEEEFFELQRKGENIRRFEEYLRRKNEKKKRKGASYEC